MAETDTRAPTIGQVVLYRCRGGEYTVPAVVTATAGTLHPAGVAHYRATSGRRRAALEDALHEGRPADSALLASLPPVQGVPPLSSAMNVHLTVLTPGVPRVGPNYLGPEVPVADRHASENVAGSYQEWDVAYHEPLPLAVGHIGLDGEFPSSPEQVAGTWTWAPRSPLAQPVARVATMAEKQVAFDVLEEVLVHSGPMREGGSTVRRMLRALEEAKRRHEIGEASARAEPDALVQRIGEELLAARALLPAVAVGELIDRALAFAGDSLMVDIGDEELLAAIRAVVEAATEPA